MALTRDFRDTVKARADRDQAFRLGLYQEGVQAIVEGDFGTARVLLRDFINATIGFPALAQSVGRSDKALMRMFGPTGNPTAGSLMAVLHTLNTACHVSLKVEAKPEVRAMPVRRRRAAELVDA